MIENRTPTPRSPQELNHQLMVLYDLLPRRDLILEQMKERFKQMKEWQIPKNSELKDRIVSRLYELLPQAHVTLSFQQLLLEVFDGLCDNGTWKEIEPDHDAIRRLHGDKLVNQMRKDFIYDTVVVNSMDGGGIFDPNDAMRIERIAYQREFLGIMSVNEAMTRLYRNLNRAGGNNGEYKPDSNQPRVQRFQRWRQEFIDKYHEEP